MIEFLSLLQRSGNSLRPRVRSYSRPLRDALTNVRYATEGASILVNRCPKQPASTIEVLFRWIDHHAPSLRTQFYLNAISGLRPHLAQRRVMWNAFNDRRLWVDSDVLEGMQRLEAHCDKREIPVINRSEGLLKIRKSECARWLEDAGVRSPRSQRIEDYHAFLRNQGDLEFPLLIREEMSYGEKRPPYLVRNASELESVPFDELNAPFASEFVETRGADGNYRKYRYVAIGKLGIPFHLPICRYWEARCEHRISNEQNLAEEEKYLSQADPNHELFQRAIQMLGLDYAAIDYSYAKNGEPIVWDVNVTPDWGDIADSPAGVQKACRKITWELLQLLYEKAGMDFPNELTEQQLPLAA
jgi:hypothetical protein